LKVSAALTAPATKPKNGRSGAASGQRPSSAPASRTKQSITGNNPQIVWMAKPQPMAQSSGQRKVVGVPRDDQKMWSISPRFTMTARCALRVLAWPSRLLPCCCDVRQARRPSPLVSVVLANCLGRCWAVWPSVCSCCAGPPFIGSSAQLTRRPYRLRAWTQAGWPSWRRPVPTWREQWRWSALGGCRRSCWPG
jgi:hypothetical protein